MKTRPGLLSEKPAKRRGKDRQKLLSKARGDGWDALATPWSGKIAALVTSLDAQAFHTQVIPKHHREAISTRPMLMSGVGRQIQSGGRRTVKVSVLYERVDLIALAVTRISNELHHIQAITERWSVNQRWTLLLTRLLRRWLGGKWLPGLPDDAELLLSG